MQVAAPLALLLVRWPYSALGSSASCSNEGLLRRWTSLPGVCCPARGMGFRGLGFEGFRVLGFRVRVSGFGFRVSGFGFRV